MNWKAPLKAIVLSRITTGLIIPVCAALPVALIAQASSAHPFPDWFFVPFNAWLVAHPLTRMFLSWWVILLIPLSLVLSKVRDWLKGNHDLEQRELLTLQRMLDRPVGQKLNRFGRVAKRLVGGAKEDVGAVFREITQPEIQIELLLESLYMFFGHDVESKDDLKVTLARMRKGRIVAFERFLPLGDGPKSNPENLKSPDAAVNRAGKEKKTIIVNDIAKELGRKKNRQCVAGGNGSSNQGSMICFPVIDPELSDDVPFVITIKYFETNHFTAAKRRRYEFVLQRFSERIAMENRLRIIKEATQ